MRILSFDQYQADYRRSIEDPDAFWSDVASHFTWRKQWHTVRSGDFHQVNFKWFDGAQLNVTENCLDRHLEKNANKTALIWEPNDPSDKVRRYTYAELHQAVCKTANALLSIGV
ncbi:MAG TPA: acetyl-coenzyme A synthetase N-terminal domain-containing protein, partial [Chitinophagales bacterium]|nr:acetyl-coenzyme A synthetase N-terminal domain-containing protein [Chitinophagales bacterium]